jgi:hypothetical protein
VRRRVEAAHDVEEVAVGLEVHAHPCRPAMGKGHAERGGKTVAQTSRTGRARASSWRPASRQRQTAQSEATGPDELMGEGPNRE